MGKKLCICLQGKIKPSTKEAPSCFKGNAQYLPTTTNRLLLTPASTRFSDSPPKRKCESNGLVAAEFGVRAGTDSSGGMA